MLRLFTVLFRDLLLQITTLGSIRTVCYNRLYFLSSSLICCRSACSTSVTVSMSFGGQSWPINPTDFISNQLSRTLCQGAIFDLDAGSNGNPDSSNPSWVVGDTFLVRNLSRLHSCPFISCPFSRKMCIRCSVPHQRLLGLPRCLLRLVDQVRNSLGQSGARLYSRLLPHRHGFGRHFFSYWFLQYVSLILSPSIFLKSLFFTPIRCRYVNDNPSIPDVFDRIHCYYHVMSLRGST